MSNALRDPKTKVMRWMLDATLPFSGVMAVSAFATSGVPGLGANLMTMTSVIGIGLGWEYIKWELSGENRFTKAASFASSLYKKGENTIESAINALRMRLAPTRDKTLNFARLQTESLKEFSREFERVTNDLPGNFKPLAVDLSAKFSHAVQLQDDLVEGNPEVARSLRKDLVSLQINLAVAMDYDQMVRNVR